MKCEISLRIITKMILPSNLHSCFWRFNKKNRMKKVAFVIGHYSKKKGAYSKFLEISEWDKWNKFYDEHLTHLGDKFNHSENSSYTQRQRETAKLTSSYDLVIELHFNGSTPQANGVEALVYYSNKKMYALGTLYCKLMSEIGMKNRGCKRMTGGNGFGFLSKTKNDAILLEPFFGSNEKDCKLYTDKQHAQVIEQLILSYYA